MQGAGYHLRCDEAHSCVTVCGACVKVAAVCECVCVMSVCPTNRVRDP